ncbi:hypothetical protein ACFLQU_00660 [Verrucomicrobiota bacterium]
MYRYIVPTVVLVTVVMGCSTDMALVPRKKKGGIDPEVKELTVNLSRHSTKVHTNGVELTYELVCPVFGDETVAIYEDKTPAGASANDTMSIRIEHQRKPLGTIADKGLDAVFDGAGELKECKVEDPLKVHERYMYVISRLNQLYVGHFKKRPGDRSPFKPPPGHNVPRDPNYGPGRK